MTRRILITGASRGIGAAIARLAGQQGWHVGVNYHRSAEAAHALVQEIERSGGKAVALKADVSQLPEVQAMFAAYDAALGPLEVLINNAGMLASFPIMQADDQNVPELFGANVFSAYYCAREAVRRMARSRGGNGGVIVNMSSVASRLGGLSGGSAYAGSKGALDAFNLALAKEVGPEGIRVNAIRPGLIATEIHNVHGGLQQMQQLARSAVPLGREGSADEVAHVALWLANEQASYVHGAVIDVAGGR